MPRLSPVTLISVAIAIALPNASAETLSDSERKRLNKQLEQIIAHSQDTLTKRQTTAYRAYQSALTSDSEAIQLYLDCIEKVEFLDQGKKSSDFRDWKRNQKDRLADSGFRTALRHQLNWLLISIEASRSSEENYPSLAAKAQKALANLFNDARRLKGHHQLLQQSALHSAFARAYGFHTLKLNKWPTSPLDIKPIYDDLVFPTLRKQGNTASLRAAWKQRISYEARMLEEWSPVPKSSTVGMKKDIRPPAYEKFLLEKQPKLIWEMELDVYNAGDQSGSAPRMLQHISKNIMHNEAASWALQLQALIKPAEETSATSSDSVVQDTYEEEVVVEEPAPPTDKPATHSPYIKLPTN